MCCAMNRPLLVLCISFIVGIFWGTVISVPAGLLLAVCTAMFFLTALFYYWENPHTRWLTVILCLLVGFCTVAIHDRGKSAMLVEYADQQVTLVGAVIQEPDVRPQRVFYLLEVREMQVGETARPARGLVRVTVQNPQGIYGYGDLLKVTGQLRAVDKPGNPGQFDYQGFLERRGIHVVMSLWKDDSIGKLGTAHPQGIKGMALSAKHKFMYVLDTTLAPEHSALVKGMLFGSRGMIPEQVSSDFQRVSLIHVLCVSGFHVGLVLAGFLVFFHMFKLPIRWEAPLASVVLIFYAVMTGLGPAVIRATVMGLMVLWARRLGRERDWPTAMVLAASIILVFWPRALWEPGFQLSFAVAWGILYLTPWVEKKMMFFPRPLRLAVAVPLVAELTAAPLVAYHFHMVSLVGVITNIIVAPLVAGVMLFSGVGAILGLILIPLAGMFNATTGALLDVMLWVIHRLAALPRAAVYLPSPSWWMVMAVYILLACIPKLTWPKHRSPILLALLLAVSLTFLSLLGNNSGKLTVHFIDVGQGDAALVQTPGGKNMLIDAGGWPGEYQSGSGVGNRVVLPYLQALGINNIDVLMISHPHEDHAGGAMAVIQRIPVKLAVIAPLREDWDNAVGWERPDPGYYQLLEAMEKQGVQISEGFAGQQILLDNSIEIVILSPHKPLSDLNDGSLVVKITYGGRSFLFTGDIGENIQRQLSRDMEDLKSDVLKIPHHGSRFFAPEFFAAVNPGIAVIQVGRSNRFGHPAPQVIAELESLGAIIYRNDQQGAVTVVTDGQGVWVDTFR